MPTTPEGWRVTVRPTATTLSPHRDVVVAYDLEGRPQTWFEGGTTYKRTLASDVVARRTVGGVRRRWTLSPAEAEARFARAAEVAADAAAAHAAGGLRDASDGVAGDAAPLAARLRDAVRWTPDALRGEADRFAAAYAPIAILPPDAYGAVVVQATFGCAWNRCTYCTFYQDRPFQVRSRAALEAHVAAVRALFGRALAGRRSVFLADGNALVLSQDRLLEVLDVVHGAFPGRDVTGFVDVFGGERTPVAAWRTLRARGVRRVAVGLETGHDPLLAYLNKPGGADAAAAFVGDLKRAGLEVAAILMVGVGGHRFAEGHLRDTEALLARLPLGAEDVVYLSPFVRHGDSRYAALAERDGLRDLDDAALAAQEAALRAAARRAAPAARVARYAIDEVAY